MILAAVVAPHVYLGLGFFVPHRFNPLVGSKHASHVLVSVVDVLSHSSEVHISTKPLSSTIYSCKRRGQAKFGL
jgi:hypothetical protein